MTKIELIEKFSLYETMESKAEAERIFNHLMTIISTELVAGNSVALGNNFGEFKVTQQSARSGVALGVSYNTPAKNVPKFRASSALKLLVAGT